MANGEVDQSNRLSCSAAHQQAGRGGGQVGKCRRIAPPLTPKCVVGRTDQRVCRRAALSKRNVIYHNTKVASLTGVEMPDRTGRGGGLTGKFVVGQAARLAGLAGQ
jgi:hypothetical protein